MIYNSVPSHAITSPPPILLKFLPDYDSLQRNLYDILCYIKCVKERMSIEHLREWYWQDKAKLLGRNRSHYHCIHPKSNMTLNVKKTRTLQMEATKTRVGHGLIEWLFFTMTQQPPSGPRPPDCQGFTITLKTQPQSVGLFRTSEQPDAETSTWQKTTLTTDIHPISGEIRTHSSTRERPQTHALIRAATGIGHRVT